MNTQKAKPRIHAVSLRQAALVSGTGLLVMVIFALMADAFINQNIVPGDAGATVRNISENAFMFRAGIAGFIIVAVLDVIVAWGLYIFLKPVDESVSLLAAWLRLVYAAILVVALGNLLDVVQLLGDGVPATTIAADQPYARVMLLLGAFSNTWVLGLVFFSLSFFPIGYLALKSGYIPKALGVLVIITPVGYLADCLGTIMLAGYDLNVKIYTFAGELTLMLWLIWKGMRGFDTVAHPMHEKESYQ